METPSFSTIRSALFVPGDDVAKLTKALAAGAHAVVADLEDAVAPAHKHEARRVTAEVLSSALTSSRLLVRVNSLGSGLLDDDLAAIEPLSLDGLVLPKVSIASLAAIGEHRLPLVAMVETAKGLQECDEIACLPPVKRLALGGVDLSQELRLTPRSDGAELLYARAKLCVASAAAGLVPPLDTPYLGFLDEDGLARDCVLARSLGMGGKACIHPAQIGIVNREFAPTPEELAWARGVIQQSEAAAASGKGATHLNGYMIDEPVLRRARQLIADASKGEEIHG